LIGNSVTSIGESAFSGCTNLTNVNIPDSVTNIGPFAFSGTSLTNVTIPGSVTNIGNSAFSSCRGLTKVFFDGNAPAVGLDVFDDPYAQPVVHFDPTTVYFLPGTTGWSTNFAGLPTAIWTPEVQTADGSFGVKANQFGFNVSWATGKSVVVEASTNLGNPIWTPLQTNVLTSGTYYFSDAQRTNYPSRFYRIRSP
jgi:hypothetical protein